MTQEQKAKAYDKAFEEAKAIHNFSSNIAEIKRMEEIFPELKMNEDEKIKNKLIRLIKMSSEVGGLALHKWEADEMLAWLKKQGQVKKSQISQPDIETCKENDDSLASEDEKIRKAISQCVEDMRGQFEKLYNVHHKDAIAWLEKQGVKEISELAKSEDKQIMKEIAEFIYNSAFKPKDIKKKEKWLTWLEKQSEKSLTVDIESMIEAYEQRLLSQCNGVRNSPIVNMCVTAFKHGVENTLDELHLKKGDQKPFDYENTDIQQKDFAPKPQRIMEAEAKEALYDKIFVSKETIRLIIELFISWNGETESIDVANLPTAVEYICECLYKMN